MLLLPQRACSFSNILIFTLTGSTHFGIAGWYSARALQQGMIVSKHQKMLAVWFSFEIRIGYAGDML